MSSEQQLSQDTAHRLRAVRSALLRLHKTLLEFERQAYEREQGRIGNSYQFLQLVMSDPWFAWLRQLSALIVEMDELLAAREPASESTALALIEQSRLMLTPNEFGSEFQRKYFTVMQQSPEVVVGHSEFANVIGPARLSKEVH